METITLTINGQAINTRAGRTVLEVACQHGIYIPTLCHHEALRPIGACRLCQVEDEKRGIVVPACVTQVSPGLVIQTDSPRVKRNRRNILRLLLAAHPESCLVCNKGNRCELRNLSARLGLGNHGLDPMPYHPWVQDLNPFIIRDLSKCILCGKCVRADQEVVVEGVIDYNFRGFAAHPATLFNQSLEKAQCTFCGTCLAVCPTGALSEQHRPRLDHAGFRNYSVCSYCACGCALSLEHDGNLVRGVQPSGKPYTANGITLCVKGHFGHDYLVNPDRLRTPLIKTADGFRTVSWDQVITFLTDKIKEIRDQYGPEALAGLGGARSTNEEGFLFQKFFREVIGSGHIDSVSRALWSQAYNALAAATGFTASTSSFKDLEASQAILLLGLDPERTAPVLGYHLKRAVKIHNRQLLIIDTLGSGLTSRAEVWLRPKVGSELELLQGLIKVILKEGLIDRPFVAAKTLGLDQLQASLTGTSIDESARLAMVAPADLRRLARIFAAAPTGMIVLGDALAGQPQAENLISLAVDLLLLTGKLGKDRCGLIPVLTEANAQGSLDVGIHPRHQVGISETLPSDAPYRRSRDLGESLKTETLDAWGMMAAAKGGRLKGLFVLSENPVATMPDRGFVTQALGNLSLLVVQDLFLTETAVLADVVLPATAWAEKDGTATSMERRVQRMERAVLSPGDIPPEWRVLMQLAQKLGHAWSYQSVAEIFQEIEQSVRTYSGLNLTELPGQAIFWPQPGLETITDTLPHGIGFPDGRARFLPVNPVRTGWLETDGQYPLWLILGPAREHHGGGDRSGRSKRLRLVAPEPYLEVCAQDMAAQGLVSGGRVRLVSSVGAVTVPLRASERVPAGVVFLPWSFPEAAANMLTAWPEDLRRPNWKYCPVRLEMAD